MKIKPVILCFSVIAIAAAASYGLLVKESRSPGFHDYRVMAQEDYTELIDPTDNAVREKALTLRFPEEAYKFVRDKIAYSPILPAGDPYLTLKQKEGSCLGKAALLASLYRAMGLPRERVRVVVGIIQMPDGRLADHAWVDIEHQGKCYQQDPSLFLGRFEFDEFPNDSFAKLYAMKETFVFNDEEFAIVSQLNMMK